MSACRSQRDSNLNVFRSRLEIAKTITMGGVKAVKQVNNFKLIRLYHGLSSLLLIVLKKKERDEFFGV